LKAYADLQVALALGGGLICPSLFSFVLRLRREYLHNFTAHDADLLFLFIRLQGSFKYPLALQECMGLLEVLSAIGGYFVENKWAFLFYAAVILLIYVNRKRFEWQGPAALYKTKLGLRLMEKWGTKYRGFVQILGYIGMGFAFIGILLMIFVIFGYGPWMTFVERSQQATVMPVVPGVPIPGFGITVPLIIGLLSLFVVVVIHEFSHGVVSRAHDVPVKSSGLFFLGPLAGAFVEPDDKKLAKKHETAQYSLIAAGPFSNILSGIFFMLVLAFAIAPALASITEPAGVLVNAIAPDLPADNASMQPGTTIVSINDVPTRNLSAMMNVLDEIHPGEEVILGTDKGEYRLKTTTNPTDPQSERGYIGIANFKELRQPRQQTVGFAILHAILDWLDEFFRWLVVLSFGLGFGNLLPLVVPLATDGGQITYLSLKQITGSKAKAQRIARRISLATIAIVLILLFIPFIRTSVELFLKYLGV
jgi:membrane-associated protease RseP (regulator of RpoE activity)